MNIFVGNLSYNATEDDVRQAFEGYGQVESVNIIKDRVTGQPRGFGFVEMPDREAGESAINGLNGTELLGRSITVNEARPRAGGGGGGHGGGGRHGGGHGGGGRHGGGHGGGRHGDDRY